MDLPKSLAPVPANCTILVVEDHPETQDTLSKALSMRYPALEVHLAQNGTEGLEIFRKLEPEIVLTDLSMPRMHGLTMAAEIRKIAPHADIIVLTASNDVNQVIQSISIGISSYVLKPVELKRLFEAIDLSLQRIGVARQLQAHHEALRASEKRLHLACRIASAGAWEWDLRTGSVVWSDELWKVYGLVPGSCVPSYEAWLQTVHPDERDLADRTVREGVRLGSEFELEWRVRDPGGERWLMTRGQPLPDTAGAITTYIGFVIDVTAQKRFEQELLRHRDHLNTLVRQRTAELQNRNDQLAIEIMERKQAQETIHCLNAELEQRVRERTAELETAIREHQSFSYSVSHDLRAPLRHINSYSTILTEDYGASLPEAAHDYLKKITNATRRMGLLIDHLLELSQACRKELELERIDLSGMAQEITCLFQSPQEQVGARIFSIQQGLTVRGDRILVRQMLQNLFDNAWKFSRAKLDVFIEFGTTAANGKTIFFIKDNGVGFDMQYREKLFQNFQRLHGNEFEGNGIGLATVHRIVERHGGSIWAESVPGEGTTFYFTLPSSADACRNDLGGVPRLVPPRRTSR